ncbi:S1 domain-containing post-transcriptional regulator GSP13 [Alkalicoccobacillus plakortidis]|uniref:S1 domain-containing post-transcriptional regulator GSP13 n=1 Tax=Alkalicoccobacillus plakortidis TaxID=444060 RepID=A0ABT0XI56_9BACI|nr:S1 domain-containing post-transcriptional regulator GSP13 [Alkalicoccobacillus plakortidis]MCM2675435.1 S1 domain-containing post-transcriptional regulator GSP13 [Alkalicoccobacillus plakortidis]
MANYEVGSIIEGKITGIKPFGAFVAIDEQKQGLVHISEVAHGFVKDINDVLTVGDEVKVKVISVDENSGKISLSIRATQEAPARPASKPRPSGGGGGSYGGGGSRKPQQQQQKQGFNTLEDKLKEWLKQSNEIQADLNKRAKK